MPIYLKSLLLVLAGLLPIMVFARRPLAGLFGGPAVWNERFLVFLLLTLASFLTRDFWVFCIVCVVILWRRQKVDLNIPALYFFLLLAVPPVERATGIGPINYLLSVSYLKILAVMLLLPLALKLRRREGGKVGDMGADVLVISYILLKLVLAFIYEGGTGAARGSFNLYLELWLPYYVMSRHFRNSDSLKEAMTGLLVAALIASILAVVEAAKHWAFYVNVRDALNVPDWSAATLLRGEGYRAQGASGQPIVLGFIISLAMSGWLYLQRKIPSLVIRALVWMILLAGMAATISRGPWVGGAFAILTYSLLAPGAGRRTGQLLLLVCCGLGFLALTPYGAVIYKYLPFVSEGVDDGTIDYRGQLFRTGIRILSEFPLLGTPHFMSYMENLRQGQGIIDPVNTYLCIALPAGYLGLALWLGPIVIAVYKGFAVLRVCRVSGEADLGHLVSALLAALLGALITIGTVSPIYTVPIMVWCFVGILCGLQRALPHIMFSGSARSLAPQF